MGLFGFLKKKEDGPQGEFKDKVIDEIDRLNREFASSSTAPSEPPALEVGEPDTPPALDEAPKLDMPPMEETQRPDAPKLDEPAPVEPALVEPAIEEPKDIEEDMEEKKETLKKMKKEATKKPAKKKAAKDSKELHSFNEKIEKIKKKLETSKADEVANAEVDSKMEDLRTDMNQKVNDVIDQLRDVNLVVKNVDLHHKQIAHLQSGVDALQAHIDELSNSLRGLDTLETLTKDVVMVKNAVRQQKDLQTSLDEMKNQVTTNSQKIDQMLALVEALTE